MQLSFFSKDFSIITLSSSTYLFLQLSNGIQTEQACKNRSSRVMTVSQSLQTLLSLIRTEESIKKNWVMRNPHMIPSSCSSMLVPWDPKDSFESKTDFCKGHLENRAMICLWQEVLWKIQSSIVKSEIQQNF